MCLCVCVSLHAFNLSRPGNHLHMIYPFSFLRWTNQYGRQPLQPLNHLQPEVQHITQLNYSSAPTLKLQRGKFIFFGIFPHKHCGETTVCFKSKIQLLVFFTSPSGCTQTIQCLATYICSRQGLVQCDVVQFGRELPWNSDFSVLKMKAVGSPKRRYPRARCGRRNDVCPCKMSHIWQWHGYRGTVWTPRLAWTTVKYSVRTAQ